MKLPESIKPVWRTIQVIRISKGLDDGLRTFIVGPYLYDIFRQLIGAETALLYASIVWAIYCGLNALLEIPTGLFADVFGRVRAIITCNACNFLYALGLASLVLFRHSALVFGVAILISAIRATAYSLHNGSYAAWVVDIVREHCPDFGYERLLARGYTYYSWSMVVGAAFGVTLYLHGVAYVAFVIGAFVCLSCTTFCMAEMRESRILHFAGPRQFWSEAVAKMGATLSTAARVCHRVPVLWYLLLTYAGYYFLFNVVGYLWPIAMGSLYGTSKWSIQWYLMAFGVPATCAISSQILNAWSARYHFRTGTKAPASCLIKWMLGTCFLGTIPILVLGITQWTTQVPFGLFAWGVLSLQSSQGIIDPSYSALINQYIPAGNSQERATIMSFGTMLQGLLILVLLVPSSMSTTGSADVVGWLLPSGIMLAILIVSARRVWMHEKKQLVIQPES